MHEPQQLPVGKASNHQNSDDVIDEWTDLRPVCPYSPTGSDNGPSIDRNDSETSTPGQPVEYPDPSVTPSHASARAPGSSSVAATTEGLCHSPPFWQHVSAALEEPQGKGSLALAIRKRVASSMITLTTPDNKFYQDYRNAAG